MHPLCLCLCRACHIKLAVSLLAFLVSTLLSPIKMQIHQHGASVTCKTLTAMCGHGWRDVRNVKHCHQRREGGPVPMMSPPQGEDTLLWPSSLSFPQQVELFCNENKRAIENSWVSREYKLSNELLKVLCFLNQLIN